MKQIFTFGKYLTDTFGCKVYKVPISISGFTCPNIDGTVAKGGCTFCENDSFSPSLDKVQPLKGFYLNLYSKENPRLQQQLNQLNEQFEKGTRHLKEVYGAQKFLVYFQSFTNTYAPIETLQALYEEALGFENVVGISIGTRSDSVTDEILDYLSVLSRRKEVWVEYGVQSIYDDTLVSINRGHSVESVKRVIGDTKARGINVCGHLIFGLPGETQQMMLESAKTVYAWGVDSIKYHPLYVVKRTALANTYLRGEFTPIDETTYIDTLVKALQLKPGTISVQRISAGIDNETLLSPEWCRHKNALFIKINRALKEVGLKY